MTMLPGTTTALYIRVDDVLAWLDGDLSWQAALAAPGAPLPTLGQTFDRLRTDFVRQVASTELPTIEVADAA